MNITQAKRQLSNDKNVVLIGNYFNRVECKLFLSSIYGRCNRKLAFDHAVKCFKQDFVEISTYYSGSKSDCKFTWK